MGSGFRARRAAAVAAAAVSYGMFVTGQAVAAPPNFFDDFENGVGGDIVWTPWGGTPGTSTTPVGNNNLVTTSNNHNHTPGGVNSARAFEADPAAWNGYADFGATPDSLVATAWVFEDRNRDGSNPAQPVTAMLSMYGNSTDATPSPGDFTDYIQLGVVNFYPSGNAEWGLRTRYNDANGLGIIDTNVVREAGWTQLKIEVDSITAGGQIRFYIDTPSLPEQLVGTSFRAGSNGGAGGLSPVDLRWVRIGNNSPTYENFWYDDVSVVPEPASLGLLGLGAVSLMRRRRRTI